MCKIILFRIIHTQNQIKKFLLFLETHLLEPVAIQNAKTSTAFLKIDKDLEEENVNLSELTSEFIFFRIESMFCEPFSKNTNQYSQYLPSSFSIYFHPLTSVFSVFTFIHY